jgi:hypothetical protein
MVEEKWGMHQLTLVTRNYLHSFFFWEEVGAKRNVDRENCSSISGLDTFQIVEML